MSPEEANCEGFLCVREEHEGTRHCDSCPYVTSVEKPEVSR